MKLPDSIAAVLLVGALGSSGCSAPAGGGAAEDGAVAAPAEGQERFEAALASGDNGEIGRAAEAYFTVGADAGSFASVFAKAQAEEAEAKYVAYRLWLRGKDPDGEGDGWVEVVVDTTVEPHTVQSVRTVVLKK